MEVVREEEQSESPTAPHHASESEETGLGVALAEERGADPGQDKNQEQLARAKAQGGVKRKAPDGGSVEADHPKPPPVATCCICMERWTSYGAHRICCVPCGHVFGRSCLEKWLLHRGGATAKCPQCRVSFEHGQIINLYTTVHLWNDCIHHEEVAAKLGSRVDEVTRKMERINKWGLAMNEFIRELSPVLARIEDAAGSDGSSKAVPEDQLAKLARFLAREWPRLPDP